MKDDPRIERYLSSLENALRAFPVGDRAEIITEIRSHILMALERDTRASVDGVLASLGEPETVANRYLLERGLKPTKTSISPIVKWLVIGFLTTFAMMLIFVGYVFNHFDSLVSVDGKNDRVQILGGLIDVDGKKNRISISGVSDKSYFAGTSPLAPKQTVDVSFSAGSVKVKVAKGHELTWDCQARGDVPNPVQKGDRFVFDLTKNESLDCKLGLPTDAILNLKGAVGKIDLESPTFATSADLTTGKIEFEPADGTAYKFDVAVETGKADEFVSSDKPDAVAVRMRVGIGAIKRAD